MDISIVIINYNTFKLTSQCIQSIYDYEKKLHFEIILVDNNSTECDPELFLKQFPQIRLIQNTINAGFAKGNNIGIEYSKSRYILLLNSDTVLHSDSISTALRFLKADETVGVVTCRLEFPDGSVQHNCQSFPSIKDRLIEVFRLQKFFPHLREELLGGFFEYDRTIYPDWVWGTFFLFDKTVLTKLPDKKLADIFFMYVEDMQWCMDIQRSGYRIAFIPMSSVTHLMGSSGGSKNTLIQTNMDTFARMYYNSWERVAIKFLNFVLTGKYEF
jgi:GT2 family glycosyltransferase